VRSTDNTNQQPISRVGEVLDSTSGCGELEKSSVGWNSNVGISSSVWADHSGSSAVSVEVGVLTRDIARNSLDGEGVAIAAGVGGGLEKDDPVSLLGTVEGECGDVGGWAGGVRGRFIEDYSGGGAEWEGITSGKDLDGRSRKVSTSELGSSKVELNVDDDFAVELGWGDVE